MDKIQLSDLADMNVGERDAVYEDIMRSSARPEQRTALQPSLSTTQHEGVVHAFKKLRRGNPTGCLPTMETASGKHPLPHR